MLLKFNQETCFCYIHTFGQNLLIKVGISKNLVRMSKDRLGTIKGNGENEKRFLALE